MDGVSGVTQSLVQSELASLQTRQAIDVAVAKKSLASSRETGEAIVALLEDAAQENATEADAKAALSRARFAERCKDGSEEADAAARVRNDPGDLDARLALGHCLAARGMFREALEQFLAVVEQNAEFGDQAGRRAMLEVFDAVGPRSDLAEEYRSKLAMALFR